MSVKRQVLFVQGGGQGTHDDWDNKLVDSLQRELGREYEIHYPRMPREDEPSYDRWKAALEKELGKLSDGAIVVGHSIGGTVLLKALTEQVTTLELAGIFLVSAPFVGEGGWDSDDLQFPSDLGAHLPKGAPVHFFQGLSDDTAPPLHADLYAHAVPQARVHRLPGRDHQLNDDLTEVATAIAALGAR